MLVLVLQEYSLLSKEIHGDFSLYRETRLIVIIVSCDPNRSAIFRTSASPKCT